MAEVAGETQVAGPMEVNRAETEDLQVNRTSWLEEVPMEETAKEGDARE